MVGGAVIGITALAVIVYQYRRRRLGRALAIAAIGAIVLIDINPVAWFILKCTLENISNHLQARGRAPAKLFDGSDA